MNGYKLNRGQQNTQQPHSHSCTPGFRPVKQPVLLRLHLSLRHSQKNCEKNNANGHPPAGLSQRLPDGTMSDNRYLKQRKERIRVVW